MGSNPLTPGTGNRESGTDQATAAVADPARRAAMERSLEYMGLAPGTPLVVTPSAIAGLEFPTRPLYTGTPWFLAPSSFYYRMRDRLPL